MIESIIEKYDKISGFVAQENSEVEKFFEEDLNCEYVPNGVKEFYKKYDGCRLSINDIFSLKQIEKSLNEFFPTFLVGMGIDGNVYKYVPIADDGMGGYYVFLSNKEEEKVYYLDHEFPDEPVIYDTFEDFLDDILSMDSDL